MQCNEFILGIDTHIGYNCITGCSNDSTKSIGSTSQVAHSLSLFPQSSKETIPISINDNIYSTNTVAYSVEWDSWHSDTLLSM